MWSAVPCGHRTVRSPYRADRRTVRSPYRAVHRCGPDPTGSIVVDGRWRCSLPWSGARRVTTPFISQTHQPFRTSRCVVPFAASRIVGFTIAVTVPRGAPARTPYRTVHRHGHRSIRSGVAVIVPCGPPYRVVRHIVWSTISYGLPYHAVHRTVWSAVPCGHRTVRSPYRADRRTVRSPYRAVHRCGPDPTGSIVVDGRWRCSLPWSGARRVTTPFISQTHQPFRTSRCVVPSAASHHFFRERLFESGRLDPQNFKIVVLS